MKKKITIMVVVLMLLQIVLALGVSATTENQIQPRYTNVREVSTTITFSGEQGYVRCKVEGISGVTEINATVILYKKNFWGRWVETGYSWEYSVSNRMLSTTELFDANSGTEYKAELSASVLKGTWEDVEATDIKECP